MAAQATLTRSEPRFLKAAAACGPFAFILVALGGLSLGFLIWYEALARISGIDRLLDVGFAAALALGLIAAFAGWFFYGEYFAMRCNIALNRAMRWDAASWAMLTLLPLGVMQPFLAISMGRLAAVAAGLWALAKLVIAARFNQTVREVCVAFLVTRLPIIAIAELAYVMIGQRAGTHVSESNNPLLAVWGRWDAVHYIDIAQTGYYGTDMAFFPLYPALIHVVTWFVANSLVAGLLISNVAFLFGLLFFYKLVEHQYNRGVAYRAVF
jgi:hypothetical protein